MFRVFFFVCLSKTHKTKECLFKPKLYKINFNYLCIIFELMFKRHIIVESMYHIELREKLNYCSNETKFFEFSQQTFTKHYHDLRHTIYNIRIC